MNKIIYKDEDKDENKAILEIDIELAKTEELKYIIVKKVSKKCKKAIKSLTKC